MTIDIDRLSEAELIDLNRRIVQRLRMFDQLRAHDVMLKFSIGDRVTFTPQDGLPIFGILFKYNRKTVTVVADDGQQWNVAPGLLNHSDVVDAVTTPPNAIARQQK